MSSGSKIAGKKGKERYLLRLRAQKLLLAGKSKVEVSRELELKPEELEELLRRRNQPKKNDLNPEAWREYLDELTETDEDEGRMTVAGQELITDAQQRARFRWAVEGVTPNFYSVDSFLISVGLHIDDFFMWCEERGYCPWARGEEPEWHRLDRESQPATQSKEAEMTEPPSSNGDDPRHAQTLAEAADSESDGTPQIAGDREPSLPGTDLIRTEHDLTPARRPTEAAEAQPRASELERAQTAEGEIEPSKAGEGADRSAAEESARASDRTVEDETRAHEGEREVTSGDAGAGSVAAGTRRRRAGARRRRARAAARAKAAPADPVAVFRQRLDDLLRRARLEEQKLTEQLAETKRAIAALERLQDREVDA